MAIDGQVWLYEEFQEITGWLLRIAGTTKDIDVSLIVANGGSQDAAIARNGGQCAGFECMHIEEPYCVQTVLAYWIVAANNYKLARPDTTAGSSTDLLGHAGNRLAPAIACNIIEVYFVRLMLLSRID